MTLTPGTRIGVYEVVSALGAGGMGEVYRAKDTRLGRAVALKTLPPEFALDPGRRARFEREAKTLATLNHPHIAQIYGLEEVPGVDGALPTLALAMELVEGEDLAQRISRGPVPLDEAVPLARQIAEGLEAAHEAGIVHRDLKPANVRVTPDGVVKVLDFGLAKPTEPVAASGLATDSPTLTSPALTTRGVVLGTASYMAPEQAKGKPVDRRADIWAFGCVLYELLTGRLAFEGDDVTEILAAIVKSEPDWTKLPAETPRHIRTLLSRCLAKDKTQRLQHIGDARLELATPVAEIVPSAERRLSTRSGSLGWVVAAVVGIGAAALVVTRSAGPPATLAPPVRAVVDVPVNDQSERPELSPDGQRFAYVGSAEPGPRGIWIYDLASSARAMVRGTEGGRAPFWSPDGQQLAFFADDKLKVVPAEGGTARDVCDVQTTARVGGSWHGNGTIVYSEDNNQPIYRVAARGGTPQPATTFIAVSPGAPGAITSANYQPNFLPDGTHFLFWRLADPWGAYLGGDAQSQETLLLPGRGEVRFVEPRWLLSVTDDGTLTARAFDPATRQLGARPSNRL